MARKGEQRYSRHSYYSCWVDGYKHGRIFPQRQFHRLVLNSFQLCPLLQAFFVIVRVEVRSEEIPFLLSFTHILVVCPFSLSSIYDVEQPHVIWGMTIARYTCRSVIRAEPQVGPARDLKAWIVALAFPWMCWMRGHHLSGWSIMISRYRTEVDSSILAFKLYLLGVRVRWIN